MSRATIIERFQEHEALAEKFYALDVKIMRILDVASFCRDLPKHVDELFDVPHTWLSIIEGSKAARFMHAKGEARFISADIFAQLLPNPEKPLVLNEHLTPYFRLLPLTRREHFRSLAMIPLHLDGELVGSFNQADSDPYRFNPDYNQIYLERMAVKLSICLSNVIAHEQVQYLAYHDSLTALPNRRAMERVLTTELARVARYGGEFTVIFIDLDRFKGVNDLYGHEYGDALLQYLADGLRKMSRQTDFVTRLAGDEFVLIMPHTNPLKASELLARIEAEFVRRPLTYKGETLEVKISYGISTSSEELEPAELLKLADKRLYESKRRKQSV